MAATSFHGPKLAIELAIELSGHTARLKHVGRIRSAICMRAMSLRTVLPIASSAEQQQNTGSAVAQDPTSRSNLLQWDLIAAIANPPGYSGSRNRPSLAG